MSIRAIQSAWTDLSVLDSSYSQTFSGMLPSWSLAYTPHYDRRTRTKNDPILVKQRSAFKSFSFLSLHIFPLVIHALPAVMACPTRGAHPTVWNPLLKLYDQLWEEEAQITCWTHKLLMNEALYCASEHIPKQDSIINTNKSIRTCSSCFRGADSNIWSFWRKQFVLLLNWNDTSLKQLMKRWFIAGLH